MLKLKRTGWETLIENVYKRFLKYTHKENELAEAKLEILGLDNTPLPDTRGFCATGTYQNGQAAFPNVWFLKIEDELNFFYPGKGSDKVDDAGQMRYTKLFACPVEAMFRLKNAASGLGPEKPSDVKAIEDEVCVELTRPFCINVVKNWSGTEKDRELVMDSVGFVSMLFNGQKGCIPIEGPSDLPDGVNLRKDVKLQPITAYNDEKMLFGNGFIMSEGEGQIVKKFRFTGNGEGFSIVEEMVGVRKQHSKK